MRFPSIISGVFLVAFAHAANAQLSLDAAKVKCVELGFKSGTEQFGKCVLQLSKVEEVKSAPQQVQPPAQTYTPPVQTYAPPVQTYAPPVQTYAPPVQTYTPPVQINAPPPSSWSPSQTVRIIVLVSPGGTTDVFARIIAQKLTVNTGKSFIVENSPGARRQIGAEIIARSPADGHSLLLTYGSLFTSEPSLYASLRFDVQRDFSPITQVSKRTPLILISTPSSGIANPRDLVDRESTYASGYIGSSEHLAAESLKSILGARRAVHVLYKGTAPALADLMGGHVTWMMMEHFSVVGHLQVGRLRAIAVTGDARLAKLPNVPTFQEIGISEMNTSNWIGVWAPGRTSPSIIAFYYHAITKAVLGQQERLIKMGFTPSDMPPDDLARLIAVEKNYFGELIRKVGIRRD